MRTHSQAVRHPATVLSVLIVAVLVVGTYGRWVGAAVGEMVSLSSSGSQGSVGSFGGSVSSDARFVVFHSDSPEFVAGDTNTTTDVFVRDRFSGTTQRVSVSTDGTQGNDVSDGAAISADGKFVVFQSYASNLVLGDTNGASDIFMRDLSGLVTTRISMGFAGTQPSGPSATPAISASGRFVAFQSSASNIVVDDTNGKADIFVADTATGVTVRASLAVDGSQANGSSDPLLSISADGRLVAFSSKATNLVPGYAAGNVYVRDIITGTTEVISKLAGGGQPNGTSNRPIISGDGRMVAFKSAASDLVPGDTNGFDDIFVYDRQTGSTVRASVLTDGSQMDAQKSLVSISAEGRYVVFHAYDSQNPDGTTNYGRSSIYVRDMQHGVTARVSQAADGSPIDGLATVGSISGDGKYVAFSTVASNVVLLDLNGVSDVFLANNPLYEQLVNHPPVLVAVESQVTIEGTPLSFTVTASDPDGDAVSVSPNSLPPGAAFDPQTGVFTWTPAIGQTGVFDIRFTAVDDGNPPASSGMDVRITVNEDESNRAGALQVVKAAFGGDATFSFSGPAAIGQFDITTTGGAGSATFSGLAPGSYVITEAPHAGWVQVDSTCDTEDETDSEVMGGQTTICNITDAAMGRIIVRQVVEGGSGQFSYVADYNDGFTISNNNSHDSGLIDPSVVGTEVFAGEHSVVQQESDGWTTDESCDNGDTPDAITLYPGQTVTCTFINTKVRPSRERGTISGMKFEDKNGNGVQDAGERGLAGFVMYLDLNNNGIRDKGEKRAITRKNGSFTFNKVAAGTYTVREKEKKNWVLTAPQGNSYTVTLASGAQKSGLSFGNFRKGEISGFVYNDKDHNGMKNGKDRRLPGWTVHLYRDGVLVGAAQTGKGGGYRFKDLGPGTYTLKQELQIGWQQTSEDPNPIELRSRQHSKGNSFGLAKVQ